MRCRPPLAKPPSLASWRLDGELRGHSVLETLSYLEWNALYADEHAAERALPANVLLASDPEPRLVTWLRRRFGR